MNRRAAGFDLRDIFYPFRGGRSPATPMPDGRTLRNASVRGYFGRSGTRRRGKHQIAVWRALVGYGRELTTNELFAHVYPGLSGKQPWWKWCVVRRAAARFAELVLPRTRPLRWKLCDEV